MRHVHPTPRWWRRINVKRLKPWLECLQAIVTIGAIIIGGIWSYRLFVKQREDHAHAVVEQRVSHLALTPDINLVQVILTVKNAGHELIRVTDVRVMLEQVLPIAGCDDGEACVIDELNHAATQDLRTDDRFSWPMLAHRSAASPIAHLIEPDESETMDFEFVTPVRVTAVRVYAFVKNDEESGQREPAVGWHTAQFYTFPKSEAPK